MTILRALGILLIAAGFVEFVVFRLLARRRENIARNLRLLIGNCAVNVVVGALLVRLGG